MSKITRREFLKVGGASAAVTASAAVLPPALAETPDTSGAILNYPEKAVGVANKLAINQPVAFTYSDEGGYERAHHKRRIGGQRYAFAHLIETWS